MIFINGTDSTMPLSRTAIFLSGGVDQDFVIIPDIWDEKYF
jgi:hypothetical protein